ncbi:amino acid adenylation domain-containing protein [Lentzea sp. DG1S-22]|uniref:non-ribosomal peptide synthetase n=1 Tax=Lentzea sp. DG1S-22 TaxID=3108822 RepID=UPI002E785110|nr:non-ribosomal peptide synthetase [Lentzea sp. DG1S-22]WVH84807.1 amino acid adenylation domain-containing protein [Lentzea sp. DG1S-22]
MANSGRELVTRWRARAATATTEVDVHPAQLGIRMFEQIHPGTAVNVLSFVGSVRGPLDERLLRAALATLAERHSVLRSCFSATEPVRRIAEDSVPVPLEVVDLTSLPAEQRRDAALAQAEERAARPMDLTTAPLWRVTVWRVDERESVLQLVAHHIIADGWSLGVFLHELSVLYGGGVLPPAQPLPPPAVPTTEDDLRYWRDRLRGHAAAEVPTDRPRAGRPRFASAAVPVSLGPDAVKRIRNLAAQEGATPFMVLLSALHLVVSAVSGRSDVAVGSPARTRERQRAPMALGPLVNMLVLRTDSAGLGTGRDLLRAVRDTCLGAYRHAHTPFEAVAGQAETGGAPPFRVLCVLQDEMPAFTFGGSPLEPLVRAPASVQHDWELYLWLREDGVAGFLGYDSDLYDKATARLMADRFALALELLTREPDTALADLDVRTAAERARLAALSTGAPIAMPDVCVHELVEQQVDRTPDALALIAADAELTYRELDERANRVAHHLRGLGVGPETRVGVCLPRTGDLITVILGVLKAGGSYVPIDPAYPAERVSHIVSDSNAHVLVAANDVHTTGTVIAPDSFDGPTSRPANQASPDNLAYTIYTSGSTGRPKGVMIEHRQTAAMLTWAVQTFSPAELAHTLASTSICFDLSIYEIFTPLIAGATVTLTPNNALDLIHDPQRYRHITLINTVPSIAQELLATNSIPPNAHTMNLAGEPLPPTLVARLHQHPTIKTLHNLYGPSEDTTYSTHAITKPQDRRTPIGVPLPGTTAHILDSALRPLPLGAIGELYLAGHGITRGYHDQPHLTADRYLPDPHLPSQRLYRTGDLARWRTDGQLDYHGRTDNQTKIRGHRIEPGEIETTLHQHPGVTDTAVALHHQGDHPQLVAYITADRATSAADVTAWLRTRLPEHLVPHHVVQLDRLPRTPNGKIDRNALPRPTSGGRKTPPTTPDEVLVARIWRDLLEQEQVGTEDNFFTLGGHSLLATRLVHQLAAELGTDVPLRLVFDHPTLGELARHLPRQDGIAPIPRAPRAEHEDGTVTVPASTGQQRLWFLCGLDPDANLAYHITGAARIVGELDEEALRGALRAVALRHEALRTTLRLVDGELVQVVHPSWEEQPTSTESTVDAVVAEWARSTTDLDRGPLFRARVVRRGEREHVLLVSLHHAIADGWSVNLLLREIAECYTALAAGREPLPPAEVQYGDVAAWEQATADDEDDLAYWDEKLSGATALDLPTDKPRPAHQSHRGAALPLSLPVSPVEQLARSTGTTPFAVLATALAIVLGKASGQDDVTIGITTARRSHPDTRGVVGFLANSLPLRLATGGRRTLAEALADTHHALGEAHSHDVPFERLVQRVRPERDQSRAPLFQVMLALDAEPPRHLDIPGLEFERCDLPPSGTQFDLSLHLEQRTDHIGGSLTYNTDLFEEPTARLIADRIALVVHRMTTAPDDVVADLDVRTDAERARLAELSTGAPITVPELCVHELVEQQVDRTPDALALIAADAELTYRELDERANRVAHHLRGLGVGPETRVGVCLPRTTDLIVTILGVLKAGGSYVPIDPAYPAERINHIVDDSNAHVLVAANDVHTTGTVIAPDSFDGPTSRPANQASPDNLAYTIYTSGSTGRPKGVMIEHRQTAAMLTWASEAFTRDQLGQTLASTSICFDLSIYEIFTPLIVGATMTLAPNNALDLVHDPQRYRHITLINTVPSVAQELLATDSFPPKAHTLNLAGEPLSPDLVARLHQHPTIKALHNLYGPSEDTTYSTHAITKPQDRRTPIGVPLPGTTAHVLDSRLRPLPLGAIGELYLAGHGITRGYHDQPELTAARYLPDPDQPSQRLYRTGDLARWRTDGQLDYHGRTDNQTKIRGHRIEPGEIETTLRRHPRITDVTVTTRRDQLVAYITTSESTATEEITTWLRTRLPEHLVPGTFVTLDRLPRTPNGKIDRNALPEPGLDQVAAGHAPRTAAEKLVARVWCELLELETVTTEDNFFALGGHSLLATRVTHRLSAELQADVPLRLLLDHPTLADLARALPENGRPEALPLTPRRAAADGSVVLPASSGQRRLWLLCRLDPQAGLAYQITGAAEISGPLDVALLRESLRRAAFRHESLRTSVREVGEEIVQVISPDPVVPFAEVDTADWQEVAARFADEPFDLAQGPLFRVTVVHAAHDRHILLLSMHHVISDGWSLDVLLREISEHYTALAADGDAPVPPPGRAQFTDVAQFADSVAQENLAFWRDHLAAAPTLDVPTDHPRPAHQTYNGTAIAAPLDTEVVHEVARTWGTTTFSVLATAFAIVLGRLAGQQSVVIGTPNAAREHPESTGVIGFLADTIPLHLRLPSEGTLAEALRGVAESVVDVLRREHVSFAHLVQELRPERDQSRSPLFQAMLAVNGTPPEYRLAHSELRPVTLPRRTSQFDLVLEVDERPDSITGRLVFNTDLFEEPTARLIADRVALVVRLMATEPDTALPDLDVRTDAERARLAELSTGAAITVPELCVHELVEQQVDRTPDALALIAADAELTYRELDERANRVAHHLRGLGVGPETRVGVCLPRTTDLIVTILGVLKAGGSYVPIDPAYPAERINHIVDDSNAHVLVAANDVHTTGTVIAPDSFDGPTSRPANQASPDNLAYTIYTSGSTGRPKGVMIEHRQTAAMLTWAVQTFSPAELAHTLASTSICFDLSIYEIFTPLIAGATVTLTPNNALDLIHDPQRYRHITLINTVPSIAQELLATNSIPPNAHTMNLAGEPLPPTLVARLHQHPTIKTLHNLYGPSEDTTYSTHAITDPLDQRTPIGVPLPGTTAHILDSALRPLPLGAIGELYLAGHGITRGYHDQPHLTADRYLPGPGQRLYRTGDLARWRTDGQLDYHGRTDNQTKIRGHRIEPGEIEATLRRHAHVTDVTVTTNDQITAYVTTDRPVETGDILSWLRATLPHHLVPDHVVHLEHLPRTPNGKIDRSALPAPMPSTAADNRPPTTTAEKLVAEIWEDLLEHNGVGANDNFFALGGHSLLASRVVSRLTARTGTPLPLRVIFDHPTLADLARHLPEVSADAAPTAIPRLRRTLGADGR